MSISGGEVGIAGTPIARVDRYSGTSTTYEEVVSWLVGTGKKGDLKEVSMYSDNFAKTHFKLVIRSTTQFEDKLIQTSLSLPFPDCELPEGATVALYAKSTNGTSITVDGSISGKEV